MVRPFGKVPGGVVDLRLPPGLLRYNTGLPGVGANQPVIGYASLKKWYGFSINYDLIQYLLSVGYIDLVPGFNVCKFPHGPIISWDKDINAKLLRMRKEGLL